MLWVFKDVGYFILGICGLYLLYFGTLSRKEPDGDDSQQARVWMTYIALVVLAIGALVWLANYVIHRL
jgi:uncharacterized membrane protein YuzA (DUF378 family)